MSKYPELKIEFSRSDNAELVAIDADLRECEEIRNQLVSQMAEIDSSIQKYRESLYSTSEDCFNLSGKAFGNVSDRRVRSGRMNQWDKANLAVGAASAGIGAATAIYGFASSHIKEYVARKKYDRAMDALLVKKIALAEEKMPYVAEIYDKMASEPFARMEKLYSSLFGSRISGEYDMLCKQISMFKSSFGMALKARYIADSFNYIIAEMEAWLNGSHDSDYKQKSTSDLFCDEVESWPQRFGFRNWNELSVAAYESDDSSISLPLAFVFSEPATLSRYVRIKLPMEDKLLKNRISNCDGEIGDEDEDQDDYCLLEGNVIQEIEEGDMVRYMGGFKLKNSIVGLFIERNRYYKGCVDIVQNSYVFPKEPKGFGILDVVVILLEIALVVGYVFLILSKFSGWFLRLVFFAAPVILTIKFPLILYLFTVILPHNIRESRYFDKEEKAKSQINSLKQRLYETTIKL